MNSSLCFFDLSHAQRSAIYDLIASFGLKHVSAFGNESIGSVEFFAKPTSDGKGYSKDTCDCLNSVLAICGGEGIDDWSSRTEVYCNEGGTPFSDRLVHIVSVKIQSEPFSSLNKYGVL